MAAAIQEEESQSAQYEQNRAKSQSNTLPGAVARGCLIFIFHGELLAEFWGPNATNRGPVALSNQ